MSKAMGCAWDTGIFPTSKNNSKMEVCLEFQIWQAGNLERSSKEAVY